MSEAPTTISKADFDRYSARWVYIATEKDTRKLEECFFDPQTGLRRTSVSYPAEQLGWLLSTVGAHRINAQFLAVSDDDTSGPDRFMLALHASDATGAPLSAYHLSSPLLRFPRQTLTRPISTGEELDAVQVPHYQVAEWLTNWTEACKLHPDMFTTQFGTLKGYSFSIGDMMLPLFNSQPVTGTVDRREVQIDLCLHKYYSATKRHEPTYTFGLVLRLYSEAATHGKDMRFASLPAANGGSSEPFYDMSTPCPPNI